MQLLVQQLQIESNPPSRPGLTKIGAASIHRSFVNFSCLEKFVSLSEFASYCRPSAQFPDCKQQSIGSNSPPPELLAHRRRVHTRTSPTTCIGVPKADAFTRSGTNSRSTWFVITGWSTRVRWESNRHLFARICLV